MALRCSGIALLGVWGLGGICKVLLLYQERSTELARSGAGARCERLSDGEIRLQ